MVYSPLDQFKIAPLISLQIAGLDLSFTNFTLAALVTLFVIQSIVFLIKEPTTNSSPTCRSAVVNVNTL